MLDFSPITKHQIIRFALLIFYPRIKIRGYCGRLSTFPFQTFSFQLSPFYFLLFTFSFLLSPFYFLLFTFSFLLSPFKLSPFNFLLSTFSFQLFPFNFLLSTFSFQLFPFNFQLIELWGECCRLPQN